MSQDEPSGPIPASATLLSEGAAAMGLILSADQLAQFARYLELLLDWNRRLNLTAIREPAAVQRKHFLDSLTCAAVTGDLNNRRLVDVGAGAGFPGLPLKILYPALSLTLVESVVKKGRFLSAVVEDLGLDDVEVVIDRAENVAHMAGQRGAYDWAVARAVAALPVLAEYLLPFCRTGGHMLAQKGPGAPEEVKSAASALTLLGGSEPYLQETSVPGLDETRFLVVVQKANPTPDKYPRSPGIPAKRPIYNE